MKPTAILFPAIVQALLTVVVLLMLAPARARSLRDKRLRLEDPDVRLGRINWDEQATKVGRNYANQFELPVLFYAVIAFALVTAAVDYVMLGLAWVFAVSRIAHAAIHVGPNVIAWRGAAFIVGLLALAAMWVKLALHLL